MRKNYRLSYTLNNREVKATASIEDKYISFCVDGKRFKYKFLNPCVKEALMSQIENNNNFQELMRIINEMKINLKILYKPYNTKI